MFNLTPHAIVVRRASGDAVYPPSGLLARVDTHEVALGDIEGVPAIARGLGAVQIPEGAPTTGYLLVSSMVLEAAKAQLHPQLSQMVAPDTGPTAIREGGQVKAVTRLIIA